MLAWPTFRFQRWCPSTWMMHEAGVTMCGLDGGLWPVMWISLIVCITIYALAKLRMQKK